MLENLEYIQNFSKVDQPEVMRQILHNTTGIARQNFDKKPLVDKYSGS